MQQRKYTAQGRVGGGLLNKVLYGEGPLSGPTLYQLLYSLFSNCPQYTLFAPQILHKPLFLNAPGSIAFSQEHFKTMSYAKFGGQTECIMGNWKIVNTIKKCKCTPYWEMICLSHT